MMILTTKDIIIVFLIITIFVFIFCNLPSVRNREERHNRLYCTLNLMKVAKVASDKNIKIDKENIPVINDILAKLRKDFLMCHYENENQSDIMTTSYIVITLSSGNVVITENADNHDTEKMDRVNLPYIRYCLYQPDSKSQIMIGQWNDRSMNFEKIIPYKKLIINEDTGDYSWERLERNGEN